MYTVHLNACKMAIKKITYVIFLKLRGKEKNIDKNMPLYLFAFPSASPLVGGRSGVCLVAAPSELLSEVVEA